MDVINIQSITQSTMGKNAHSTLNKLLITKQLHRTANGPKVVARQVAATVRARERKRKCVAACAGGGDAKRHDEHCPKNVTGRTARIRMSCSSSPRCRSVFALSGLHRSSNKRDTPAPDKPWHDDYRFLHSRRSVEMTEDYARNDRAVGQGVTSRRSSGSSWRS